MEYHAVVVTALCQLYKVLASLWRFNEVEISIRLTMRKRETLPEEHDPNKALVECYLDSFLELLILVLAYCVREGKKVESSNAASRER